MGPRARSSVVLDVSGLPSELRTVDALAHLALALSRQRRELVLLGASPELRELIELAGLTAVLHD